MQKSMPWISSAMLVCFSVTLCLLL
jgi:hypothetical protein